MPTSYPKRRSSTAPSSPNPNPNPKPNPNLNPNPDSNPNPNPSPGEHQIMKLAPTEFIEHNMCCGPSDPDETCLKPDGSLAPTEESDKVIRVESVEVGTPQRVNMVIKPASEYYPTWPQHSKRMQEEGGRADTLSSGRLGYLFNGRKTGATLGGLLQLNMCNERAQAIDLCFEDQDQNPVTMKRARIQLLDIDMVSPSPHPHPHPNPNDMVSPSPHPHPHPNPNEMASPSPHPHPTLTRTTWLALTLTRTTWLALTLTLTLTRRPPPG